MTFIVYIPFEKFNWGYPTFSFRPYSYYLPLATYVKEQEAFSKQVHVVPEKFKDQQRQYPRPKAVHPTEELYSYQWLSTANNYYVSKNVVVDYS